MSAGARDRLEAALPARASSHRPRRIALAVDAGADDVVRWAAREATAWDIDADLVDVAAAAPQHTVLARTEAAAHRIGRARELLARVAPSVRARPSVRTGSRVDELVEAAAGADLLVLGTDASGWRPSRRRAGLAVRVAERSGRPVVVVPHAWRPSSDDVVVVEDADRTASAVALLETAARGADCIRVVRSGAARHPASATLGGTVLRSDDPIASAAALVAAARTGLVVLGAHVDRAAWTALAEVVPVALVPSDLD